jgi:hypothetical protein
VRSETLTLGRRRYFGVHEHDDAGLDAIEDLTDAFVA